MTHRSLGEGGLPITLRMAAPKVFSTMFYVYLIKSLSNPSQKYVGYTQNVEKRIRAHNAGESKHTSKFMPWELISFHAFKNKMTAQKFENYMKSGSGKAFANKRLWES